MANPSNASLWKSKARTLAARLNLAWFLEKLALPLLIASLLGACLILLARREYQTFPWQNALLLTGGALLSISLIAWLIARNRFTSPVTTLVRIESSMELDNSLTAANHGIRPWPEVPATISDGTRWNWTRLLTPPAATLLLLSAAFLLPVSARHDPNQPPPEEPANRQSLQNSIDQLREDNTINEDYLDEIEKKIDELREHPAEEWFDHSALEATDSLKQAHEQQLKELERDLRKAERALNALQKHSKDMGPQTRQRLLDEFDQALEKMDSGAMKPNIELLDQLQGLDLNQLGNLSLEQLDQLRENMRQQAQNMRDANGEGQGQGQGGDEWLDDLLNQNQEGQGQGNNPGQPGNQPGNGGIQRGPGTAPDVLGQQGQELNTGDMQGLQSRDLSNTLPGDLLELQDGEHDIDTSKVGIREGGAIDNLGEGGDLIWKIAPDLHPAEKKALRDFFK